MEILYLAFLTHLFSFFLNLIYLFFCKKRRFWGRSRVMPIERKFVKKFNNQCELPKDIYIFFFLL